MRKKILYIAFKACNGRNIIFGEHPFPYNSAVRLISFAGFVHLIQIALLVFKNQLVSVKSITGPQFFLLLVFGTFFTYLMHIVFPKSMLENTIIENEHTSLAIHAKLISFGYILINLLFAGLIFLVVKK